MPHEQSFLRKYIFFGDAPSLHDAVDRVAEMAFCEEKRRMMGLDGGMKDE